MQSRCVCVCVCGVGEGGVGEGGHTLFRDYWPSCDLV